MGPTFERSGPFIIYRYRYLNGESGSRAITM